VNELDKNSRSILNGTRAAILLLSLVSYAAPAAERYPIKPIRLIVSFPPGGSDDAHGRLIAERLGDILGRQIIVDNRPGAGGMLGQDIAAKAPGDGYTLLLAGATIVIKPIFYPKIPYDFMRDLTPVSQIVTTRYVLVVHPSLPVKSARELIALAKAKPGKLNFASSGVGATPHLCGELFKQLADVNIVHVPYKGGGPAMTDLIAGQVDMSFATMGSSVGFVQGGKLRALAVTSPDRSKLLPQVPSMAEAGVPGYEMTGWYALFAPSATPREIITQLNVAVGSALTSPELQERLYKLGSEPAPSTPEQMLQRLREETVRLTKVITTAGIKSD
jgi:tripartite-type tricarboxylate transporter receptor subunit TctC